MVHIELMVRKKVEMKAGVKCPTSEMVDRDHRCKNRDFRDFHMLEMTLEI